MNNRRNFVCGCVLRNVIIFEKFEFKRERGEVRGDIGVVV